MDRAGRRVIKKVLREGCLRVPSGAIQGRASPSLLGLVLQRPQSTMPPALMEMEPDFLSVTVFLPLSVFVLALPPWAVRRGSAWHLQ